MTVVVGEQDRLRLAPGVVLRHDRTRDQWTLLAPERVLVLDEVALDIVRACCTGPGAAPPTGDGVTVGAGIDFLAEQFAAPRGEIASDALELLRTMCERGFITS